MSDDLTHVVPFKDPLTAYDTLTWFKSVCKNSKKKYSRPVVIILARDVDIFEILIRMNRASRIKRVLVHRIEPRLRVDYKHEK